MRRILVIILLVHLSILYPCFRAKQCSCRLLSLPQLVEQSNRISCPQLFERIRARVSAGEDVHQPDAEGLSPMDRADDPRVERILAGIKEDAGYDE